MFGRYLNVIDDEDLQRYFMLLALAHESGQKLNMKKTPIQKKLDKVLSLLKEKYPQGKIQSTTVTVFDIPYYVQFEERRMKKQKIKIFKYETKKNLIFTDYDSLYFYDPKIIERLKGESDKEQQKKQQQDTKNLKNKLF